MSLLCVQYPTYCMTCYFACYYSTCCGRETENWASRCVVPARRVIFALYFLKHCGICYGLATAACLSTCGGCYITACSL